MVKAGFDVVSCAGNHALDKGTDAIDLTVSFYRDAGIVCAGIQPVADGALRPYEILEVNGIRCAVFSLTQTTNGHALPEDAPYVLHTLDDPEAVQEAIAAGEADADCSIVFVHWGTEYAAEPDESPVPVGAALCRLGRGGGRRHPSPCAPAGGVGYRR